ncbi:hypothetical protein [Nostoc sp.]|uniref:hypothetical protein n=1 Tax=Nostoc sp. TaxID=1180 RepID=UPI00300706C3
MIFDELPQDASRLGHWALVLGVRVASLREAVGAASRREVSGIGHRALVLSVPLRGSKLRVVSLREAVGAASRREVSSIGHWKL